MDGFSADLRVTADDTAGNHYIARMQLEASSAECNLQRYDPVRTTPAALINNPDLAATFPQVNLFCFSWGNTSTCTRQTRSAIQA